jgi:ferric-dicitrate binding protein FerR (iron transport regulator)
VTSWTEGKLAFRDENFTDVVRKINRWYNVELVIKDEALRSYSYQATFMDETLDEVLKLLHHSAPIVYRDLGRKKRADGTFEKRRIELYYKPS